jgi:hypothetical protein
MLGLAVAVSRHHNGEPRARVGAALGSWPDPAAIVPAPDLNVRICMHLLGGVTLRARHVVTEGWRRGGGDLETTPEALTVRASFSRALSTLHRRGHLVLAAEHEWLWTGYCLTESGLAIGLPHKASVPDDLGYRLRVLSESAKSDAQLTADLPPPALQTGRRRPAAQVRP